MGLDIELFRADRGGNPDVVRESQRRRFKDPKAVDEFLALDETWRKAKHACDTQKADLNKLQKEIGLKKRNKEPCDDLLEQKKAMDARKADLEAALAEAADALDRALIPFGNIVHASVPVSNDEEADNLVVSTWGDRRMEKNLRFHHELLYMIGGVDYDRGASVAGHRGYFLKGVGVELNFALINYAMEFLRANDRGYELLQTPFLMKKEVMAKTAQLEQFDEELYKVSGSTDDKERYLIATSEQPISAMHQGEWILPAAVPIRYAGVSTCFRKEAGKTGKDVWGIFRVHQFEKVEQFTIVAPDESWNEHERMRQISEEFHQSLGIPYRVVVIVSGELNNAAAKKYDLEAWFPGNTDGVGKTTGHAIPATFRELVSCSNCTDYQSRSLEIRYGTNQRGKNGAADTGKQYVHMLNSTLTATGRGICAILENHQTETGVNIPEPLRKYMGGKDFLPFVHKELPKGKGAKGKKN